MGTYKIKRHVTITATGSFGLLSLLAIFLFIQRRSYADAMIALGSLGFTLTMGLGLSKAIIMATDGGIKRSVFGKLSREYKWMWIYNIRTFRSSATGVYFTTLSWAKEPQYQGTGGLFSGSKKDAKNGTFLITSQVAEYSKLLKEIREKAPHAEIDSLTEEIISKGL